jgi:hypothetical protein
MNIEQRLRKLEEGSDGAARQQEHEEACICFPSGHELISLASGEAEAIAAIECPLHGDRLAGHSVMYRSKWYTAENMLRLMPPQFVRAWRATPGLSQ